MASRGSVTLEKISTREISKQLERANGDYSQFFYLYVSTSGTKHKEQKRRELSSGQQTLDKYQVTDSDSDDTESEEEDDDEEEMETDNHPVSIENASQSVIPPQNDPPLTGSKKARKAAMKEVHRDILPKVLHPGGWKKVYDNDFEITYKALYFNTIKKAPKESENAYIQRVNKIRDTIYDEATNLMTKRGVNFKIDSLLSKPFLYNIQVLKKQSVTEGSTPSLRQTTLNFTKKK